MKHISGSYCSNVKLMLTLPNQCIFNVKDYDLVDKNRKNQIIRAGDFTFTIYQSNGKKVHITGIRDFEQIPSLLKFLSCRINLNIDQISTLYIVNNSTWHFSIKEKVNLQKIVDFFNKQAPLNLKLKFDPQRFPGLTIKWILQGGCAILFNSGKVNIMGVKSQAEFFRLRIKVLSIVNIVKYL